MFKRGLPGSPSRIATTAGRISRSRPALMQGSKLGLQTWVIAIYLLSTNLKGASSMKLHRDLGVTQKTAWYLAHRIRETWRKNTPGWHSGPVEVDETYVGGRKAKMSHARRKKLGKMGYDHMAIVAGVKDRKTNQVDVAVIDNANKPTLHKFVADRVPVSGTVYTDDFPSYKGMPHTHEWVRHGAKEYAWQGPHEWHRELLGHAQAGIPRDLPPHEREAP